MTCRMRRRIASLVVLLCAGSVLTSCGVPADHTARPLDPRAAPYRVLTRDRAAPPVGAHRIVVYFVRDGALTPVPRRIPEQPTPTAVLKALSGGPSDTEREQGLTSGLPFDADARLATRRTGAVVTVSLPAPSDSSNRSDTILAFGQLVLSLTALPDVSGVLFRQDGQPLQVPRSDGSLASEPLTRADYRELVDPS